MGAAVDHVVALLRDEIVKGRLVPGQRLVLQDLQAKFGYSRSTLREALSRLAAQQLVSLMPNRGAAVQELSKKELVDLFQIREQLEGLAARLAAQCIEQGDNRRRMLKAIQSLKNSETPSREDYVAQNQVFHSIIVSLSGNEKLPDLLDRIQIPILMSRWRTTMTKSDIEQSIKEHQQITDAILAGDPDGAEKAMNRHQQKGAKRVLAMT
jgi:DNA-binding GntR family transcriptional regulator